MNTLVALLFAFLAHAEPGVKMQFTYEPADGETPASRCTHAQVRDLPDWDVTCVTPYGTKTYSAHVVVHENSGGPSTTVEVLYWVSEPGESTSPTRTYHSTSALFHLKGTTSLADFSLSQGVENDQASLVLGWAAN
ncbi:MAG: hypothetical protein ACXVB9_05590 [Bdellovibrionota bacterium]